MKPTILITNAVGLSFFLYLVIGMGRVETSMGFWGFIILIIPFLFIMALINVILYVIYRVIQKKPKESQ